MIPPLMSPSTSPDSPCPCTSGRSREACCGPLLDGRATASTAEALMRARYSAFVEKNLGFIRDTLGGPAKETHDEDGIRRWAEESQWLGLKVVGTEGGGEADEAGVVEFIAKYKAEGRVVSHQERARFERIDGQWAFVDSAEPRPATFRREEPKIHRNDPCPCGSGKKHKKCCGA
jgi:SEC-C motif-containing protein